MTPFIERTARAVALLRANIDTDQIIPARFLRKPRGEGYGGFLFHDLKASEPGLSLGGDVGMLVAGANFGAGSSREGAVYALVDAGITCVIAPSFADIFAGNARKNGLLTLVLPQPQVEAIAAMLPGTVTVDLPGQRLHLPDQSVIGFEIDPFQKRCLVDGLDEIGATLAQGEAIAAFCRRDALERPWALLGPTV